jgi:hypothetical protein
VLGLVGQAELVRGVRRRAACVRRGRGEGFEDGEEVLLAGEALEDGGFLAEVAHALAGAAVHGQAGDLGAVEETRPPSRSIMPMVMRKVVVLPAPLRPRRPTISACSTSNETPLTTVR